MPPYSVSNEKELLANFFDNEWQKKRLSTSTNDAKVCGEGRLIYKIVQEGTSHQNILNHGINLDQPPFMTSSNEAINNLSMNPDDGVGGGGIFSRSRKMPKYDMPPQVPISMLSRAPSSISETDSMFVVKFALH
jgi:hypothetical protein